MSHYFALPQDIYKLIIDSLCDDKASLKACSLVASTWRAASQKQLHRTLVLWTSLPCANPPGVQYYETGFISPASGIDKTRSLLGASSHLLRYARSVIICGECLITQTRMPIHIKPSKTRAPDPSLAILLGNIHSLALPSLIASIELRNLIWTAMDANLQHALFSLISSDFIKDVTLYGCEIPYGVPCLRFVGPHTTSLTLEGVSNSGNRSSLSDVTPMDGIPLSSAPNLTTLTIRNWGSSTYSSSEWIAHGAQSLASRTTTLRNCSWHNNVKTLSLRSQADAPALFNFVRTFQSLTTFKFAPVYPEARTVPFPFHEVLSFPTLEYLHILSLPSSSIVWLTNSFKLSTSQLPSPYHTNLENLKIIHIDMRYAWRCTALIQWNLFAAIQHHPLPDLLRDIRVFDDVVASISDVECYLRITLLNIRPGNGPGAIVEYEGAKKTLVDLHADLKALKLQVVY